MDERGLRFIIDTLSDKYSYRFKWLGRPIIQLPQDIVKIQELIWDIQPDFVIETGIAHGGGLILYASILSLIGKGRVVGIDIDLREENEKYIKGHELAPRITIVKGSSVDTKVYSKVREIVAGKNKKILVILDSNHTHAHVLKELLLYSPLVSVGSYIVVMDTVVEFLPPNSFPDRPWGIGNNPYTAVKSFLGRTKDFAVDEGIDKQLLISVAPGGYLKRVK